MLLKQNIMFHEATWLVHDWRLSKRPCPGRSSSSLQGPDSVNLLLRGLGCRKVAHHQELMCYAGTEPRSDPVQHALHDCQPRNHGACLPHRCQVHHAGMTADTVKRSNCLSRSQLSHSGKSVHNNLNNYSEMVLRHACKPCLISECMLEAGSAFAFWNEACP